MKFIILKKKLEEKINNFISTEIEWLALNSVKITGEKKQEVIDFLETLEDDDDVQSVYTNVIFEKLINVNYWNRSWNFWSNMLI